MITQALGPIVVYGTGSIGFRHLQLLAGPLALPVRPERRRELAGAGYPVVNSLNEAREKGARACVIATDTGRHLADAREALELGFDLLVEKPLCVNSKEAKALLSRAHKKRRRVFTACVLRFSRSLNAFREQLVQIGKIHSARIECQSYLPDWRPTRDYRKSYSARANEGGVLRDLIHEIDYAGWIFGWPKALQGTLLNSQRLKIQAEESADLLWTTPLGVSVSIRLDYLTRPTRRRMVVCGDKGTMEWDGLSDSGFAKDQMYADQLKEFQHAVVSGKRPAHLATGEEGFRALAICDAARLSSKHRRETKVRY